MNWTSEYNIINIHVNILPTIFRMDYWFILFACLAQVLSVITVVFFKNVKTWDWIIIYLTFKEIPWLAHKVYWPKKSDNESF